MRQWLLGIVAASVLSAAALTLTPEGRVKQVEKTVCGIVCALALLTPVAELDAEVLSVSLAAYRQAAQTIRSQAEEEEKNTERQYIQEQYEAYIWDKAATSGVGLTEVTVTVKWNDEAEVWYPWSVSLGGTENTGLSSDIEAELGIPEERQVWNEP